MAEVQVGTVVACVCASQEPSLLALAVCVWDLSLSDRSFSDEPTCIRIKPRIVYVETIFAPEVKPHVKHVI